VGDEAISTEAGQPCRFFTFLFALYSIEIINIMICFLKVLTSSLWSVVFVLAMTIILVSVRL